MKIIILIYSMIYYILKYIVSDDYDNTDKIVFYDLIKVHYVFPFQNVHKIVPNTVPWGTPRFIGKYSVFIPSTTTRWRLFVKKSMTQTQFIIVYSAYYIESCAVRTRCQKLC